MAWGWPPFALLSSSADETCIYMGIAEITDLFLVAWGRASSFPEHLPAVIPETWLGRAAPWQWGPREAAKGVRTHSCAVTDSFQAPKENCFPKYTCVHNSCLFEGKFQLEIFPSVIPWVKYCKYRKARQALSVIAPNSSALIQKLVAGFLPTWFCKTYRRADGHRFLMYHIRNLVTQHWEVFWYSSVFKVRNVTSKKTTPKST